MRFQALTDGKEKSGSQMKQFSDSGNGWESHQANVPFFLLNTHTEHLPNDLPLSTAHAESSLCWR